jgi:hypothetical protein
MNGEIDETNFNEEAIDYAVCTEHINPGIYPD